MVKILDGGVAWEEKIALCQSQSGGQVLDFSKAAVFTKKLISRKLQSQEMNIRDFTQPKASSVNFPDGSRLMFCLEQLSNTEFMKKAIKDSGLLAVIDAPEPPEVMVPTGTSATLQ
ncbi:hypothetical protein Clacol_005448 [Clathrus columnatus]|uniref:Uncharacterized protein n=1 Tax=Clathrus columnatus TaxID=1419009 RepID=A0AAV5AE18_9AGAM|nr:hypothetical protein Clacol_005448 [Clathrus columnatus]